MIERGLIPDSHGISPLTITPKDNACTGKRNFLRTAHSVQSVNNMPKNKGVGG